MKTSNNSNAALRIAEVGHVWREVATAATSTVNLELVRFTTFRVRVGNTGSVAVTIDGVLAMTMGPNEVEYFNAGIVDSSTPLPTIQVSIQPQGGAQCWVQIAEDSPRRV